jgi:hypothetical protein
MHAATFLSRGGAATVGAARVIQGACGTTARTATRSLPTTCWSVNIPSAPACRWRSSSACGAAVGVAARGGSSSVHSPLSTAGAHHSRHQPPQRGMKSGRKPWLEDRANRPAFSRAELDHVLGGNISSSVSWLLSASQLSWLGVHSWGGVGRLACMCLSGQRVNVLVCTFPPWRSISTFCFCCMPHRISPLHRLARRPRIRVLMLLVLQHSSQPLARAHTSARWWPD